MSVQLQGVIQFQRQKIAVLNVFTITSLILSMPIDI